MVVEVVEKKIIDLHMHFDKLSNRLSQDLLKLQINWNDVKQKQLVWLLKRMRKQVSGWMREND